MWLLDQRMCLGTFEQVTHLPRYIPAVRFIRHRTYVIKHLNAIELNEFTRCHESHYEINVLTAIANKRFINSVHIPTFIFMIASQTVWNLIYSRCFRRRYMPLRDLYSPKRIFFHRSILIINDLLESSKTL